MKKSAVGGFLAGAALMYFVDPDRGRRRRAIARDRLAAAGRDVANELDKAGRDLRNRATGFTRFTESFGKQAEVDGPLLVERVRSAIGRAVSHPHAIRARAEDHGRIVLEGPILKHEVPYLLKRVKSVRGVGEVVSQLEVHDDSNGVASLQGGVPRRPISEFARQNWTPSLRVASALAGGAALFASPWIDRRFRAAARSGGAALLARAIVNRPFREIFGVGGDAGAVHFEKTIHIDATVEEVYAFWANFENFPKFMTHLKEVRPLPDARWHWIAAGPGGISIPWDAEIVEQRANQRLAWRSVPGSVVRTTGSVRFDAEPGGGTRVSIRMSYCPPAGVVGHAVAWLFGADPKSEMDDDLARLKSMIELGKTRAHGAKVTREQVPLPQHA